MQYWVKLLKQHYVAVITGEVTYYFKYYRYKNIQPC